MSEIPNTNIPSFQTNIPKEAQLPPGDLIVTPQLIEQLKLKETLSPGDIPRYLAGQLVQLNAILNRPEIKSLYADIPEFDLQAVENSFLQTSSQNSPNTVTKEEKINFDSWSKDVGLEIQSGHLTINDLDSDLQRYLSEAKKRYPDAGKVKDPVGDSLMDMMLMGEVVNTEEDSKKIMAAIAAAAGDPATLNILLAYRHVQKARSNLSNLLDRNAKLMQERETVMKDLNLLTNKSSTVDLAKSNAEMSKFQSDITNNMMLIQKAMGQIDEKLTAVHSLNEAIGRPFDTIVRNMASV